MHPRHFLTCTLLAICALAPWTPAQATNLVIATVDNAQMLQMRALSSQFEKAHPGTRIRWVVLDEHALRQYVSADIITRGREFDIVTIGMYETPLWARRNMIEPFQPQPGYDEKDLIPAIRKGLSYRGRLFAAPLYGESSMLFYRKDLMRAAGQSMPAHPTWKGIAALAEKLNDPLRGIHGICLRGKPGWGENMSLVTTMVNAFGGQWFDMRWNPQLQSSPWKKAVGLYVELLRKYGPANASRLGYNGNLKLFSQGHCALWVGATVAAGDLTDPDKSSVAAEVGFAPAPVAVTSRGSHWLWAWALAIPTDIDAAHRTLAQQFLNWATSRDYVQQVAAHYGWGLVPPGTRRSTYAHAAYRAAAPWADLQLQAIDSADPDHPTLPPSPYVGVQYVQIPDFAPIGNMVGRYISRALAGKISVDRALSRSQRITQRMMSLAGYPMAGHPEAQPSRHAQVPPHGS